MDPPIINDSSAIANPYSYSLSQIWPFSSNLNQPGAGALGLPFTGFRDTPTNHDLEQSSVTAQSGTKKPIDPNSENGSSGKRLEHGGSKAEVEASSGSGEQVKDYIHVRARRDQATDSHSLAERPRREKISERVKILQDIVPSCNKVIGKALVLDEIINYIQSLQRQVEFLSMKLEALNSRMEPTMEKMSFVASVMLQQQVIEWKPLHKQQDDELVVPTFDGNGMILGSQAPTEYAQGSQQPDWLHMEVGNSFERAT